MLGFPNVLEVAVVPDDGDGLVVVARMADLPEHHEARDGGLFHGSMVFPSSLITRVASSASCHDRAGGVCKLKDLEDSRFLRGRAMNIL